MEVLLLLLLRGEQMVLIQFLQAQQQLHPLVVVVDQAPAARGEAARVRAAGLRARGAPQGASSVALGVPRSDISQRSRAPWLEPKHRHHTGWL